MKRSLLISLIILTTYCSHAQTDTVLNRYVRYLYATIQPGDVSKYVSTYDSARQWADVNYLDTEPANWKVSEHLKRVRDMALVWTNPTARLYHQPALFTTINRALDHWLTKRYQSINWWHNKIGVPQYMRDILVLLRDTLRAPQLTGGLEVMAQNDAPSYKKSTGANLVWSADLAFHAAALIHNNALMQECMDLIRNEITITTKDGVQPDYSFHQHGARLQMYQYGKAFLWDNVRLAWQVRGTLWAYPPAKMQILVPFILNGWQWMARGTITVPGTLDRSVSRPGTLQSADIRQLIPFLCELDSANAGEFRAIAARQNGNGKPLEGFHYYPYSDFAVYHHNGFSFFLKTISDRTLATESINHENLKGRLLNSGDGYLVSQGNEYVDLMPNWNWDLLPGITGFKGAATIIRKPFVGSVSNGRSGVTAMDYALRAKGEEQIAAKKLWACHNNVVVCLIADLQTENLNDSIYTALDQCRWQGNVTVNTQIKPLTEGDHPLQKIKWIQQGNFAYIFPEAAAVNIQLHTVTASWQSINASGPAAPKTEKIFTPVLQHGRVSSKPLSAAYVLAACSSMAQVQLLVQKPSWKILRNTGDCQAVQFTDGVIMASFYTAGSLALPNGKNVVVDQPCLLLIAGNTLYASNPAQKAIALTVRIGQSIKNIQLPENGVSVSVSF